MHKGKAVATVLLASTLALAGCGASSDSGANAKSAGAGREAGPGYAEPGAEADAKAPSGKGGAKDAKRVPLPKGTHIVRTATVSLQVKSTTKALAAARAAVERAGGHVGSENTDRAEEGGAEGAVRSTLVLRVPQERYDAVLAELAGAGRLVSRSSNATDVTSQVVDVESRIATQRASVARVRALMARAVRIADVVQLEGELSSREAALESLLAQQASLKDRTTFSTITLELSESEREGKGGDDDGPGFLDALAGGWGAFVTALRWIVVVLAAAAPFLAALAALYAVWRWLVRPRLPRRTPEPFVSAPPAFPPFPGSHEGGDGGDESGGGEGEGRPDRG
ncbi:DUF4349 domain-containing protein [Streptomyces sp. NPDC050504]|uniref:DUF4349 domain-containing protein n=1 Tax=Streptomyces sp. NPDC050504 TaxID=3365618 RepID=UPI0037B85463